MRSSRALISLIFLAVVVLLNLPVPASMRLKAGARDSASGPQSVWHIAVSSLSHAFSSIAKAKSHAAREKQMLEDIADLEFKVAELEKAEKKYQDLRKQLELRESSKYKLVLCEVISRGGAGGWWQTVTLNKGSDNGIEPNRAVITRQGLIGTTVNVSSKSCEVLLLYDSNCKVACRFERTSSLGVLRGSGLPLTGSPDYEMLLTAKPPVANYVERDQQLMEGDRVVTSGLGGIYPEGLFIGTMKSLSLDEKGLYYCAEIEPAEDMRELNYVFVVLEVPK